MLAWLLASVLIVVYVAALGVTVRWLVGAPVGVTRTLVTGVVGFFVVVPLLFVLLGGSGLVDPDGVADGDVTPGDVVVGAVAALWVLALGAAFLAALEFLWPSHRSQGFLPRLKGGRDRVRRAVRYVHILRVAVRHGLGPLLRGRDVSAQEIGPALVAALSDAGVTFVKLGQVLATRKDVVPPELARHLAALQSDVAPEDWGAVEAVIGRDVGAPLSASFSWIDPTPLAAASIGQVHAATLRTGETVVVKVQRPNVRAQVETDIDIARRICRRVERRSTTARRMQIARLLDELAASLRAELDYRIEAKNLALLRSAAERRSDSVRIPKLFRTLTTRHVLTIERMGGTPLAQAGPVVEGLPPSARHRLAAALVDEVLEQILVDGVFHADLHPGNIMVADDGTLSLIDFGSVAVIGREQRDLLAALLAAFEAEDARSAVIAIRHLTLADELRYGGALLEDVGELFTVLAIERDTTALSERLLRLFSRHGLAVPGALAAAVRTMAALQEAIAMLDGPADFADLILSRVHRVAASRLDPARLQKLATAQSLALAQFARRLPDILDASMEAHASRVASRRAGENEARIWMLRVITGLGGCAVSICLAAGAVALVLSRGGPALPGGIPIFPLIGATIGAIALIVGTRSAVVLSRLITVRS
ncbi:AarF/UbiB family protein [Microbacterium sp. ProA8]|uniref:ABC1 kinase family protein n=1 Tax=Microbacterium chionoecetis TaxID=3153754 RepID=UPI003265E1E2